jgi:hypothetical protein
MSNFKLDKNKGYTGAGHPLFLCSDNAGKTFLAGFYLFENKPAFRYYKTDDIKAVTPVNGVYKGVGYFKNDLYVPTDVVNALTLLTGPPDGVVLDWDAGFVQAHFPQITNLAWQPVTGPVDSITTDTINKAGSGAGGSSTTAGGEPLPEKKSIWGWVIGGVLAAAAGGALYFGLKKS